MQRIIPITIDNDYIIGDGVEIGGEGSHDEVVLRTTFKGEIWQGTSKKMIFANSFGLNPVFILLTAANEVDEMPGVYDVPIPFAAKEHAGNAMLCVEGTMISDDTEILKCVTQLGTFKVLKGGITGGVTPPHIAPDIVDQLQSGIDANAADIAAIEQEQIGQNQKISENADNIAQNADGIVSALAEAKSYADTQDAKMLKAAKEYADDKDSTLSSDLRKYSDDQDAEVLAEAKAYTDKTTGAVKSVNGNKPDSSGNISVHIPSKVSELENNAKYEESQSIFVREAIPEITDVDSFRTYFYEQRKATRRKWIFEISEDGINENIVEGVGGRPDGTNARDKAFIMVEIPFSEAGGFVIKVTYEGRTSGAYYEKKIFGTLDSNWRDTGWYKATFISTAVITPYGGGYVADMTARQIIDADRKGIVKAEFEDPETNELRTYYYAKQMPSPDNRAVFSKDGYIEEGIPKQTLIYVDYAGNVTTETRSPFVDDAISATSVLPVQNKVVKEYVDSTFSGAMKKVDGTDGQFALSDGKGGIRFESLLNLDTEAR